MPITRGWLIALVGALVAALAVGIPTAWHRFGSAAETTRVMIVGDSLTQGSQGDWTWRYRLARHLQSLGADIDLVGPSRGLFDAARVEYDSGDYADPDFDQDHLSQWGGSFAQVGAEIRTQVADEQPDVVLVLLGSNDLDTYGRTPSQVAASAVRLIRDVRAGRPGADVVFGTLPGDWRDPAQYNARLRDAADRLDRPDARVIVADTAATVDLGSDTWDGSHPNARGEQEYAAAFADALASIGVGAPYPRPLEEPPLGPSRAPDLLAQPGNGSVALTWSGAPGSTDFNVWMRDVTDGGDWQQLRSRASGQTHDVDGLVNGHDYAFELQPIKGTAVAADVRSNTAEATPSAEVPESAPPPALGRRDHGLQATWEPVAGASSYQVRLRDPDQRLASWVVLADSTSATLDDLRAGLSYAVAVRAVDDHGVGPWSDEQYAAPRGPRLLAPRVTTRSDDRSVLRATWRRVPGADSYRVWWRDRSVGSGWARAGDYGEWTGRHLLLAGLPSGHRYQVRVAARDGLRTGPGASTRARIR